MGRKIVGRRRRREKEEYGSREHGRVRVWEWPN